eukprot:8774815-Alexandrium_andersonii.AAC.1
MLLRVLWVANVQVRGARRWNCCLPISGERTARARKVGLANLAKAKAVGQVYQVGLFGAGWATRQLGCLRWDRAR